MSKLQLILLGRFECLLSSGTQVSLSMRKAEVLLAYLALTPGLRHPRERLINLLWSDRGEEQARNSLRQCLSAIRKSLGDAAELVMQIDRTTVSLNAEMIEVDVHEFERLATAGDFESLITAADLYQGEFLEGISIRDASCQEWLDGERARFKRQFIEILCNVAETQLVSHDFGNAIQSAERLVRQDPLGESGWRLLMRSYFENGDRSHALQAFKRCQKSLRDELEVEPEATTAELRDQIAGGDTRHAPTKTTAVRKASVGSAVSTDHSIAVLPFDNLSGDPEQEYFSDGITDSIILNLSLFPGLIVKSRNSSFAFKQQIKSLGEISKELNVDYIVEGSIRKSPEQIRITVQLIEAATGNQVWGKRYDAELVDLFELEEELSRSIAATVTGQIESDLQRIAIARGAANQQAYDLLLAGNHHASQANRAEMSTAIDKLNQCIALDPDNASAHACLYDCHDMNVMDRWVEDVENSRKLAREHIHKAVTLDPEMNLVRIRYADYLIFQHRYDEAEAQLQRVLEQNPNDSEAIAMRAVNLSSRGEPAAALEQAQLALKLDPYHAWASWIKAESQFFCGDYDDCLATIAGTGNAPGFIQIYRVAANVKLERLDEARKTLADFLQFCRENMLSMPRNIDEWLDYYRDNAPFANPDINREIIDCLAQAGLKDELSPRRAAPESTEHSIAVLPFDNLSGDPGQEYFSDGISESIILNLSLFPGMQVKSRNSSFAFKQQIKSLGEISEELNVDYVVEGSVRKSNDRIRVTVQLIEAASGNQIWGKRYDSEIENLFKLEEDLSRTVAATVTGQIESDLRRIAIAKGAAGQESYDLLLSGAYHINQFNREATVIALDKLNQCLAQDPDNIRAHVYLYGCHSMNYLERWTKDYSASFELAAKHIHKAMELGPELALVQAYYGEHLCFCGKLDQAVKHINKALEINPNDPDALSIKTLNLELQGKAEAALELSERTYQLDPYHPWIEWEMTVARYLCGRYEEVLQFIANARTSPSFTRIFNIAANIKLGRSDAAKESLRIFLEESRKSMLSMPQNIEQWARYIQDNYPKLDQDILDCLLQAGLEDEIAQPATIDKFNDQPSIAVLPFENMSGDPEQEYFSDGITASVILGLGLFKGLTVKSQNSSFAYKNSSESSEQIAEKLNVSYLVEGSIRKSAHKVRISVQLIESASGNQIWGKQYDAELEDILELEQELSRSIAATISGRIRHTLQQSSVRRPAKNLQSFDYLMRGLYHFGKFTTKDFELAKQEIGKCLEIDPENSTAHTNLGMIHHVGVIEGWSKDPARSRQLASHHLEIAVDVDPDNALAHAYLSELLMTLGDYGRSEFHADKAIELNPTDPDGYMAKAEVLGFTRRVEEAIPYAHRCLHLDPHSVGAGWVAGGIYRKAGQYEKAIKTFRSISHPPASIHALIATCFIGLGLTREARDEMKRFQELAHQQMSVYPQSEDAWRAHWRNYESYQYEEESADLFEQLIEAGLCDDLIATGDDLPSIAVLPFENMSGDPEQEHFSDGITTDIIATLSRFKHLRTVSRYSVLQYRDQRASIPDIATQQNVRYILEGSVRRSGDRIRVSAELIDSEDEKICWSERYDRDLDDLFAVQDDITRCIALAMKVHLDDGDMALHRSIGTASVRAWELVMAAVDLQDTYIRDNILESRGMARQAIELDPGYAYAWICLAWTFWQEVYSGWGESVEAAMAEATSANQHAHKLNPEYSEAWSQAGMIHLMNHEPEKAVAACARAVDLEPGNAEVQALMAFCFIFTGDFERARMHDQQILKLCPMLPNWYYLIHGQIDQYTGNLDGAIQTYKQAVAVEPDSPLCRFYLINALMEAGDEASAKTLADEIRALDKAVTGRGLVRGLSMDRDLRDSFQARLDKFDLY